MKNLYNELMELVKLEAFYHVDHVVDGDTYRVFTYRLASYTEFLEPSALECRGHTFRITGENAPELVSLPMEKFFNLNENPFTMGLDSSNIVRIDSKLDGSLISTVKLPKGDFTLKSKTSFSSEQAKAAMALLDTPEYEEFRSVLQWHVDKNHTVSMEYMAPDNQIVIGYDKPMLRVLHIRDNVSGEYVSADATIPKDFRCPALSFDGTVTDKFLEELLDVEGIEGYVLTYADGLKVKVKTDWYCHLHLQKDQVNVPRRLFEAVLYETSDDLKALFHHDPITLEKIAAMEEYAGNLYNELATVLETFYHDNKHLDRKEYAILGQKELKAHGVFSQAMNLYLGKDMGLKEHMVKNYTAFGVPKDES